MGAKDDHVAALLKRAGVCRVFAVGPSEPCVEVRFAIRRGQAADVGGAMWKPEWTHACVEGDQEWTDLQTGERVKSVESVARRWTAGAGAAPA